MKRFLVFVNFMIVSLLVQAQDANAKKILDGVSAKIKTFAALSANFNLKSISSKGKDNGAKTGTIALKGQKYFLKQGKTEIICDGAKIYNFDGAKTITVSGIEEANSTLSPQIFLTNFYDKDFTYKLISSIGSFHEIQLIPIDKRKNVQQVNVFVDKAKSFITKAKITDKSNNKIELSISNVNTKANLSDVLFAFNKTKYPKDVEVLD
jgi:outer membrane lipoprotein carrier protein